MTDFRNNRKKENDGFLLELYKLYSPAVKKTIISKLYSTSIYDIEDCVQEVFLVAVKKLDELREHPKLIGWFTIASKNIAMKHNKKFMKEKYVNNEAFYDCPDTFCLEEQVVESIMFTQLIKQDAYKKIFDKLTHKEKELYNLRWIKHLSYEAIEYELGISQSAVKNRLLRLRKHIKAEIKKQTN